MQPNPYEPSKTTGIATRVGDGRRFKMGMAMAAIAFVLPFLASIVGYVFVAISGLFDRVPQGAMALAYLGYLVSYPAAVILFCAGVGLAIANRNH
jgi:hypothetical protein